MYPQLKREAAYLSQYEAAKPVYDSVADHLGSFLTKLLTDSNIPFAAISARAKSLPSVRSKLLLKRYNNPKRQLMDVCGARVILFHQSDVIKVVDLFHQHLKTKRRLSVDKRLSLGLREFGYASYHMIAELPQSVLSDSRGLPKSPRVCEIQIRTIFEHSWAEIEHETVYKSHADFPRSIRRRFASLAAVLELLEHDFHLLLGESDGLVDSAMRRICDSDGANIRLDTPTLLAVLELHYPNGLSFRQAVKRGVPFPPRIEVRFLLALRRLKIKSVLSLLNAMRSPANRKAVRRYARFHLVTPDEVSHLALLAILIGKNNPDLLAVHFPELSQDPAMRYSVG